MSSGDTVQPDTTNFITRSEYEARHSELRIELIRLSTENDSHFKWVVTENEKIRQDVQAKFDILVAKLNASSVDIWKILAGSLLSFLLGGGFVTLLNFFHFGK